MENVTVVSALYYIGRDKWKQSGFGLGNDRYTGWVKNILSLDTNLILFTDDHYYDRVVEVKKQYDSELKSLYIVKSSIDEMESYKKYYLKISCLMQSPEFVDLVRGTTAAEMGYPLYNVLMFNKVNFLKQAKELNPFSSTHFFWADAGAFRNELHEYENVKWPSSKSYFTDKVVFFSHAGDQYNIGNQRGYFMSQSRVVQGGYFIVPVDKVDFLREEFDKIVDEILAEDYIGSDEKVFDLLCKRNMDQVRMVKAGWFEFYKMTMSKVKLYITFYSKPEFIKLQYEQLKKYCKDSFEYIIINNAKDEENERLIKEFAGNNRLEVIAVEKDNSSANSSHFVALNSAFNQKAKHDQNFEAIVVMDSDIFAYRDFSFLDILDNNLAAAVYQQRQNTEIEYLWPGFTILSNKANISDIDFSWKTYTDTGGMTDNWLKKYNITPKWVKHTAAIDIETEYIFTNPRARIPYKKEYRSQFIEDTFFHYYRGCNWDEQQPTYHIDKFNFLQHFLDHVDEYGLNLDEVVHYDKAQAEKGWEGKDFNYHGYKFAEFEKTLKNESMLNYRLETDSQDYHVLANATRDIKDIPGLICEIGTRRGGSMKVIIDALLENRDFDRNVVGLDPYGNIDYNFTQDETKKLDYTNDMRNETFYSLYGYVMNKPVNLVLHVLEDTEFFKRFSDGVPFYKESKTIINDYALVFFDGPHHTDPILKEMEFFQPRTQKGGIWVFDDVKDYYPHNEVIEPWLFANGWELIDKTVHKASYRKM